jgi:wyosine [tRNA(Phe)-imidazoG37] synthetase (radical SAM superfamily)
VDRSTSGKKIEVHQADLQAELESMLYLVQSGELFEDPNFESTPTELRRLNDVALSGDGEPTSEKSFLPTCQLLARLSEEGLLTKVKLVCITNSTQFHKPQVQEGLSHLMQHGGEIWSKLDAGTADYYDLIDRSGVPFERVLGNIKSMSQQWPLTIQTLFCAVEGEEPSSNEVLAYVDRLLEIKQSGGYIKSIQLHTVAREPGNHSVEAISLSSLNRFAELIRKSTDIQVDVYSGRAE